MNIFSRREVKRAAWGQVDKSLQEADQDDAARARLLADIEAARVQFLTRCAGILRVMKNRFFLRRKSQD